jgi:hypothetical protein
MRPPLCGWQFTPTRVEAARCAVFVNVVPLQGSSMAGHREGLSPYIDGFGTDADIHPKPTIGLLIFLLYSELTAIGSIARATRTLGLSSRDGIGGYPENEAQEAN